MPQFRKKPVVIEAVQWFKDGDHPAVKPVAGQNSKGWVETLEGGHIVTPGDWIIQGVQGELYPCKPDIFEAIYEPVGSGLPNHALNAGLREETPSPKFVHPDDIEDATVEPVEIGNHDIDTDGPIPFNG